MKLSQLRGKEHLPEHEAVRIEGVIFARLNKLISAGVMLKEISIDEVPEERGLLEQFRDNKLLGPHKVQGGDDEKNPQDMRTYINPDTDLAPNSRPPIGE